MLTLPSASLHLHSSLAGFVGDRANKRPPSPAPRRLYCCSTSTSDTVCVERNSHVQVLLCLLDVPLDRSVDVEVKFLGHGQRDQRSSLWVRFLTAKTKGKTHHRSAAVGAVVASRVHLTSNPGCDAAGSQWGGPRRWPVRTGGPRSRPRPPQTAQTRHRDGRRSTNQPARAEQALKHVETFVMLMTILPATFCQTSGFHCWRRSRLRAESAPLYGWRICQSEVHFSVSATSSVVDVSEGKHELTDTL